MTHALHILGLVNYAYVSKGCSPNIRCVPELMCGRFCRNLFRNQYARHPLVRHFFSGKENREKTQQSIKSINKRTMHKASWRARNGPPPPFMLVGVMVMPGRALGWAGVCVYGWAGAHHLGKLRTIVFGMTKYQSVYSKTRIPSWTIPEIVRLHI